ncbi:unnamed protein product [Paramecium sonneborni]|uniref:Uncharacterized protein n=1 Tax=Paramecium sonneborni TaxID=65129 RepID=A0A8S1QJU7_9CILI|nr:unnamed protein product [Paramecium sonneborni]
MSSVQHYLLRKSITLNKNANIFMTQQEINEQRLYRNGKIVPYYIVGKPEIMDKKQNIVQPTEDSTINIKIKPISYKEYKSKLSQQQQNIELEEGEMIEFDMELDQVENEIEQVKNKQKKNHFQLPLQNLSQADIAAANKDDKIMKSFEQQQISWQKRVTQSAQRCKRNVSQSIYNQIQVERQKNEDRNLLDLIQTDAERHGNKLWERQLRSSSEVMKTNQKIKAKGLEIIRSMNNSGVYKRPKSFVQRFEERQDKVNELTAKGNSIDNLQVEGLSQLARETSSLCKIIKDQKEKELQQKLIKNNTSNASVSQTRRKHKATFKRIVPAENLNHSQEIISINYDKSILRQQGKLEIYKQFF